MDKDKKYSFSRWMGSQLSDETIEANTFEEWIGSFKERYDDEELNLMEGIFNNRKKEIKERKEEAAKPEVDKVYNYHATGYYFHDCPTCDGEDEDARMLFADSLDELMKWCREYRYDRIYRNGKQIARCEYEMGFHRIYEVKVCKEDSYGGADKKNIIKVY